jgi:hypothetical protein
VLIFGFRRLSATPGARRRSPRGPGRNARGGCNVEEPIHERRDRVMPAVLPGVDRAERDPDLPGKRAWVMLRAVRMLLTRPGTLVLETAGVLLRPESTTAII